MAIRNSNDFGAVIRKARLSKKLSQVELARKASMRQALISDLENGTTSATLDTMLKIRGRIMGSGLTSDKAVRNAGEM